jgi:glycosyltransferase involved in cell wall biosynthesis
LTHPGDRSPRVGIAMLTLVPGEMGGSESYARGLCGALGASSTFEGRAFVSVAAQNAIEGLPTEVVSEYPSGRTSLLKVYGLASGALRRRRISRHFADIDVVHYPFTVPMPRLAVPSVVTLHDVQHLDLPGMFTPQTRAFRRLAYDRAAHRADVVIVPSEFVRGRAEALLGLDPSRVVVVPHGIDHSVFTPADVPREPFVLYPARVWPHKNHARLLDAFALLRRERPDLELVLTGGGTEALAGPAGVRARGIVPQAELVKLYQRAACVVFPSLYEGFGAPPLEAMACGAPVAASNVTSLPEVCGDAAVFFEPRSSDEIAAGVAESLVRCEDLSRLGLARSRLFTWSATAARHEGIYRRVSAPQ